MYIQPNWPAPNNVHAVTTTRQGGFSTGAFATFNLGITTQDTKEALVKNHTQLHQVLALPSKPCWLEQIHSNRVIYVDHNYQRQPADASFTYERGVICAVLTADCIPILLCNNKVVAAIHAGWRGIAAGIIENTLDAIKCRDLIAWLGPAIGPQAFYVGDEVRDTFVALDPEAQAAFTKVQDTWLANIYLLAKQRLWRQGVRKILGGEFCTYKNCDMFYSHRRDGITGRMASLIWLD